MCQKRSKRFAIVPWLQLPKKWSLEAMFLDFYQFREQPFGVTPDPRYLYFSPGHREALASLYYGIETGRGFLSLVAEPGMGKTTLLFQLLQRWRGYVHSAFLFQTQCDSRELIRYLMNDLGSESGSESVLGNRTEFGTGRRFPRTDSLPDERFRSQGPRQRHSSDARGAQRIPLSRDAGGKTSRNLHRRSSELNGYRPGNCAIAVR